MSDPANSNGAPLSWRDVYTAVNDAEARIIKAVKEATAPLATMAQDHETRLRHLETIGSQNAVQAQTLAQTAANNAAVAIAEAQRLAAISQTQASDIANIDVKVAGIEKRELVQDTRKGTRSELVTLFRQGIMLVISLIGAALALRAIFGPGGG